VISVITATYKAGPELEQAIASLEAQTYEDWQHVVVADGPDPELRVRMNDLGYRTHGKRVFVELGRNWHGFMGGDDAPQPSDRPGNRGGRGSRAAMAVMAATFIASGDHIGYLDSDCRFLPRHLELAANALETSGADLVYSKVLRIVNGRILDVVGDGFVAYGKIDGNGMVHSVELLKDANWRWGGDADWDVIVRWLENEATYEFVPVTTVHWTHAADDLFSVRRTLTAVIEEKKKR
jgi:glycosyltransferase involved in cell wall biosynthesis